MRMGHLFRLASSTGGSACGTLRCCPLPVGCSVGYAPPLSSSDRFLDCGGVGMITNDTDGVCCIQCVCLSHDVCAEIVCIHWQRCQGNRQPMHIWLTTLQIHIHACSNIHYWQIVMPVLIFEWFTAGSQQDIFFIYKSDLSYSVQSQIVTAAGWVMDKHQRRLYIMCTSLCMVLTKLLLATLNSLLQVNGALRTLNKHDRNPTPPVQSSNLLASKLQYSDEDKIFLVRWYILAIIS